jgi:hypothetical protein
MMTCPPHYLQTLPVIDFTITYDLVFPLILNHLGVPIWSEVVPTLTMIPNGLPPLTGAPHQHHRRIGTCPTIKAVTTTTVGVKTKFIYLC